MYMAWFANSFQSHVACFRARGLAFSSPSPFSFQEMLDICK